MWLLVLGLFKKHLLKLVVVGAIIGSLLACYTYAYYKGKHGCEAKVAQEVVEEMQKRDEAVERARAKIRKLQDQIRRARRLNPINDKRDSCILSNDPFKKDCLEDK